MKSNLQCEELFEEVDDLHQQYGCAELSPIYGAGCIHKPRLMLLFMNPTGRNVSADWNWKGLRAPWLGTKNMWRMMFLLRLIEETQYWWIKSSGMGDWTDEFAEELYKTLDSNSVYVTNLAKCTQRDARKMNNKVFKAYLDNVKKEIVLVEPNCIVAFGNQVSSVLLGKKIKVGDYIDREERLNIDGKTFRVFPVYYPVGQGMRNMKVAIERVRMVLGSGNGRV